MNGIALDFPRVERVYSGAECVNEIPLEMARRGLKRALLVTGPTIGRSTLLTRLMDLLGDRCASSFSDIAPHVPAQAVRNLVRELKRTQSDTIISVGGGSAVDAAKAAVACILADEDMTISRAVRFYVNEPVKEVGPLLFHMSIPTTLSAGEYHTDAAGVTDEGGAKLPIRDPRMGPSIIFNDPVIADDTPDHLWVTTGIKAIDHAVEAMYSAKRDEFSDALAIASLKMLVTYLPLSLGNRTPDRLLARARCQTGALLSNFVAANTNYGISHSIGTQIGSHFGIPHGETSCLALPPTMRFMTSVAPDRFDRIAEALALPCAGSPIETAVACAEYMESFVDRVANVVPLTERGIAMDQIMPILPALVEQIRQQGCVERDVSTSDVLAILQSC